ncbi:vitamin B12-dependent ribonucleotide reductase [Frankia sp. AgKG'84/4]|uniref:vitamin B12-dependent ribonucleotide reductase n=1 Tax=Frankia sp. AgKG'84/4 TaxID=573490 RepID=UPI00200C4EC7|nr:vitamin B12-dependent ribonucleotide reductase [Frankia sp. AgKG'84/4]MCL9797198.1 vitamin B12-dependent ribonucleotide reductase [Frankia sp. AgKG'84/4]
MLEPQAGTGRPARAVGPVDSGTRRLRIPRTHTRPGVHPFDEVRWERRDVSLTNWRDGTPNFTQRGVEFPSFWSTAAAAIVASRYFRGAFGGPDREWSLRQLITRVVTPYSRTGRREGYFATAEDAEVFEHELIWLLLNQSFSFNSPVWFNVGTDAPQQVASCFILAADDSLDSVLNWYREEALLFRGGAGSGVNLSRLRSSSELLPSGRRAPGPVSYMRGADASAGAIRAGGAPRPAAKIVVLDVDHPDITEFVECKVREERKIRVLQNAGFDMEVGGRDIDSVQFQNANNAVRVTDEFMRAVAADRPFELRARGDGEVTRSIPARALFRLIARAAWECADPGLHFDDTINSWHTCPAGGPISASNSCSEYMHLDNSSCPVGSLNLLRFLDGDRRFDTAAFTAAVELVVLAMDISLSFADVPTPEMRATTQDYRQIGVGYTNLGAMLMATGQAYDSEEGRATAAAITSLLSATAYRRSAEIAAALGPYPGFADNAAAHRAVAQRHAAAHHATRPPAAGFAGGEILTRAGLEWHRALGLGERHGWRNSHLTLISPTTTTGLAMDCATMGTEPDLALVKIRKSPTGAAMRSVNTTVPSALRALGYPRAAVARIVGFIAANGHVVGAPGLRPEHQAVFDCALGPRAVDPMAQVRMMAAVQPFLSGAISKTIRLPAYATVDDVAAVFYAAWRKGLKALAVYRDTAKVGQSMSGMTVPAADGDADAWLGSRPAVAPAAASHLPSTPRFSARAS